MKIKTSKIVHKRYRKSAKSWVFIRNTKAVQMNYHVLQCSMLITKTKTRNSVHCAPNPKFTVFEVSQM